MDTLKNFLFLLFVMCSTAVKAQSSPPPIAIPFNLPEAGYVTLVVENENGQRVRNLVAETWFKAGKNIAYWDGQDDLGRDEAAAHHGLYHIPSKQVNPGKYVVRGIVHEKINTAYEFSVYTAGSPPWSTVDHTGAWMANHTPPQAVAFVPGSQSSNNLPTVFLGAYISEGPDGFIWTDLNGKKLGGKKWVGGAWTSAPFIARDAGEKAISGISVYIASVWETGKKSGQGELRLSTYPSKNEKPILVSPIGSFGKDGDIQAEIGGLAIRNGIAIVSLIRKNKLLFVDVKTKQVMGSVQVTAPGGLAFDNEGRLLVLSSDKLLRFKPIENIANPPSPESILPTHLNNPRGITLDAEGQIYISEAGISNQVKVFGKDGKFKRAIGKPGESTTGIYDPLHMNNPAGITIDSKQQLWVTEKDYLPKRVSIWSLDGKFIRAFYGPGKYGGGGTLDPTDKTKFYYADEEKGTMEFRLDWEKGESKLQKVLYRLTSEDLQLPEKTAAPETPLYYKGKRYFTNCYNSNPMGGTNTAFLFTERNGRLYPCAGMGRATSWDMLKDDRFSSKLPAGSQIKTYREKSQVFFVWTDLNEDAQVQPAEVTFQNGTVGGITVAPDLSFCISQVDGKTVQFSPTSFTASGIPLYQLNDAKVLAKGVQLPGSSGGNQTLVDQNGWAVVTQGIAPYGRFSLSGAKNGVPVWSYPNMWPGLHASHEAPLPDFSGELIGPTRLLGGMISTKSAEPISLWAINSNHGMVYLFTSDGLFVSTLFQPMRTGKKWNMPVAERGMNLNDFTLSEENFWPSITQTNAGETYLVDGARSSLVRVDGLQTIKRIAAIPVTVTSDDLQKGLKYQLVAEATRQGGIEQNKLVVQHPKQAIVIDGKLDEWKTADWVDVDQRGLKSIVPSKSKAYNVTASVMVSAEKLYAAFQTGDAKLLQNSGEIPTALFKTGGALDLMIGTMATAYPKRSTAGVGDLRILVSLVKGKPRALLYRPMLKDKKVADPVAFYSPSRTLTFDQVEDITAQLEFAAGSDGSFEISVPLSLLELKPSSGMLIKGDIGILRGDGNETTSRVYWNNKATAIVSDVPSEATLTPNLWGTWEFK
jgi:hypothetical protein